MRRQHGSRTRPACRKYSQPDTTRNKTHRTPLYSPLGRAKESEKYCTRRKKEGRESKANKDFRKRKGGSRI